MCSATSALVLSKRTGCSCGKAYVLDVDDEDCACGILLRTLVFLRRSFEEDVTLLTSEEAEDRNWRTFSVNVSAGALADEEDVCEECSFAGDPPAWRDRDVSDEKLKSSDVILRPTPSTADNL
jgi:hypothetical protein